MSSKEKSLIASSIEVPEASNLTIDHVDSSSSLSDHIDSDSLIMTAQLAILMQLWPSLESLPQVCDLSDQIMKALKVRRELCLRPTSIADADDTELDVTPPR